MKEKPIYVTQPSLPPLEEFIPMLEKIWESKILTNNGPFHQQLEKELCEFLGVKFISLFSNGTLALVTALQALNISGEVITTPYSFVATTHSLWWNNIKPVFVDIDPETCNLDPDKIEAAITAQTTAILPVHVYGNPCDVEKIQKIANRHKIKLIYDAAHAFGVKLDGKSILNFGDLSVLSFHATKVFNTFEGGAIISHSAEMKQQIDDLKNFGFRDEVTVVAPGINAKMNEVQAAMGLLQLKYIDDFIEKRKLIFTEYSNLLRNIDGIKILDQNSTTINNYSYFPIFIDEKIFPVSRDVVYEKMKASGFYGRRYFYPLISHFYPYKDLPSAMPDNLPVSEIVSRQVLCLPLLSDLDIDTVHSIANCIKEI
ncbi:MAG: aminotransferase [Bacteroidetes bacterium GWF2_43_63]|nr:MAG: aminotransferase [Bacteroidetes bacterium GWE2_42_42]OFY52998.1 MAG: aminotransferase [Bacteroidetes bacterium GWF2_43_63]HCB62177.1 aminotransferase [Bacteroidales bacterium]